MNNLDNSELNSLIPAEIKNDEFYIALQKIAEEENIKTVLEIGSSSGEGSTEAIVTGLRQNPHKPILFCMEISKTRFAELENRYTNDSFVKCYNVSSVALEQFPSENEVTKFYNNNQTSLNHYPLDRVLGWLQQDIDYVKSSGVMSNGITKIKQENNINVFDLVLIDGSEFTGIAELNELYGAKIICLDDINTFKNYQNYQKLLVDKNYVLVAQNFFVRNGYSIFKKSSKVEDYYFEYEASEQLLVRKLVQPGMTVFDVGANIGNYSLLLSKLVGISGKVYSFEPASSTFQKLQERIIQSEYNNIHSCQKAVYSENKNLNFNEFPDDYSVWNSIGKPKMANPNGSGDYIPIIKTELVEAITLDSFCQEQNIQKIDYLKLDVEGAESDSLQGAIGLLKAKAISFLQFEISSKMLEGLNREAKSTFDILIENGYECHQILSNGDIGKEVINSDSFYENYIAFPSVPVHFLTIVLNGEPFIRYHVEVFKQLPFKWHWHIVEGVAELRHDTAWSLQLGGRITDELHCNGRSCDGTTEYLDELVKQYPEKITIYRQPQGTFWDGKREMVNAPLSNINEECLLWQVDTDELWTVEQICTARLMFINNPDKTAAFYWCWYFVGKDLIISTRNCYTQNPQQEWLRTWRYKPGSVWVAHEPPGLAEPLPNGQWQDIAAMNPFTHEETEKQGLIFQHFAYVTPEQLRFKEQYYGYKNAVNQWNQLQEQSHFPVLLREYFSWVQDITQVDEASAYGVVPLAQKQDSSEDWRFLQLEELYRQSVQMKKPSPTIIVDGVFFQLYKTGIARVWQSLLQEWVNNGFAKHIVILDRVGTAPPIAGIKYRSVPAYDYGNTDTDREMLQQVCDEEGADLFISSYYTTPLSTPSVFAAYDMIPELIGWDLNHPMWREKHYGIQNAAAYIAISENTARDLVKVFPEIALESVTVAKCGIERKVFSPANSEIINQFKTKYGISKPYFILVGAGGNYKNSILFFKAFAQLHSSQGFDIVCTGSGFTLEADYRAYTSGSTVHLLQLSDEELSIAYSGAVALVYPSKYEGFGLPVLEAIACGCPVITCPNASIPEVAGEAALYINDEDVDGLTNALCDVQKPNIRNSLIAAGLEQAKKFSWSKMAETIIYTLIEATLLPLNLRDINLIIFPDWSQSEETLCLELEQVIKAIATHPDSSKTTLLIDNGNISEEEAALIISSVSMNLLMQEELDISEGLEISFLGQLSEIQWKALLPCIQARIVLESENQEAIAVAKAETIPYYQDIASNLN
ncbi:FkbM family methyltransferase [Aliterella atlantica]|uniref:Glycosyl transferase family 1 n=1 Tax=Aliterella atlantica CENA595 TaxID=1618023 RepID=A0A0D8ZT22_9CYAN|nr:FkbM family methyltransferase [Aliterella atlantica]KJH71512.1 glycosyl transferase family 1 [Aliterella atlantica CENA595]